MGEMTIRQPQENSTGTMGIFAPALTLTIDRRPPVLFLRAFAEEEFEFVSNSPWFVPCGPWTFEDAVLDALKHNGPVIGLTNRMLRGRPSAYAPLDVPATEWQERVARLIRSASVVVVVVTSSKGLEWEIAQLRLTKMTSHTIFLFPPLEASESIWIESRLGLSHESVVTLPFGETKPLQPIALRIFSGKLRLYCGHPDLSGYLGVLDACKQTSDLSQRSSPTVRQVH
jgi:hypothetical protein